MKVKELKELLDQFDDNDIVVLSGDGEGNSYSPLADYSKGMYIADSTWSGDFVDADEIEEDEDINLSTAVPALLLWPTN